MWNFKKSVFLGKKKRLDVGGFEYTLGKKETKLFGGGRYQLKKKYVLKMEYLFRLLP